MQKYIKEGLTNNSFKWEEVGDEVLNIEIGTKHPSVVRTTIPTTTIWLDVEISLNT